MFRFEIPYAAALTPDLSDGNSCPVSGNYFPYIFKCSYAINMFQKTIFSFLKVLLVMLLAQQISINCYLMNACLEYITGTESWNNAAKIGICFKNMKIRPYLYVM